jgi:hypothetical protein
VFSARIAADANEPEAARTLIKFLVSRVAFPVIIKSGIEPMARQ